MQIPRVEARLSTFLTRFEAQQQLAEAKGILEGHQAAHRELKGSPCMAAALEHSLSIGNFLNWGTRLGAVAGFRLRNLPKLQVTTSTAVLQALWLRLSCSWLMLCLSCFATLNFESDSLVVICTIAGHSISMM